MRQDELQGLCERGQEELMRMDYLAARETLEKAEGAAWEFRDWDTLSRVYMPLQEVHRQIRQTCGEGVICLDLWAEGPGDWMGAEEIVRRFPKGQLLVAGRGNINAAMGVRKMAREKALYVETFLGWIEGSDIRVRGSVDEGSSGIVLDKADLPRGQRKGTSETFALTMGLWERLHLPFLEAGDKEIDPIRKMEKYRKTIEVDYACELAHQGLADVAKEMGRKRG